MKKLFFILAFLIIGFTYSHATCPTGWTSHSVDYSPPGDTSCTFTIYYCSYISPGGVASIQFDRITLDTNCAYYLNNQTFWDGVTDAIYDDFLDNGSFSQCPLLTVTFKVERAICWKVHNDPDHNVVEVINCGLTGKCVWEYIACTDYTQNPSVNYSTLYDYYAISTELCPNEIPMLPPGLNTWDTEWTTGCYGVTCPEE